MRRLHVRKFNKTLDLKCVDLDRPESEREKRLADGDAARRFAMIYAPLLALVPLIASAIVLMGD